MSANFDEPIAFNTGVYFDITAGTLTYSALIVGYLEDAT